MNFGMTALSRIGGVVRTCALALASAALLGSCGGGTSSVDPFEPQRLVVFGDEMSVILPDGRKYLINVSQGETIGLDCTEGPVWVQALAQAYGFVFSECNPESVASPQGRMRARAGARVDDLEEQVSAFQLSDSLGGGDLVTVLAGANDVLEMYARYPAESESTLIAEMKARGARLAERVNAIVATGARVLVATVPDMGLTPYALDQQANNTDIDRANLLTRMTDALNSGIVVNIINDGSKVGLVLGDDLSRAMVRRPSSYSMTDVVTAVCVVLLPTCTDETLLPDANAGTHMWADDRWPANNFHQRLGDIAHDRATDNPF